MMNLAQLMCVLCFQVFFPFRPSRQGAERYLAGSRGGKPSQRLGSTAGGAEPVSRFPSASNAESRDKQRNSHLLYSCSWFQY